MRQSTGSPDQQQQQQHKQVERTDPEHFDSRHFLDDVDDLSRRLGDDRFKEVDDEFPAEELNSMVDGVRATMDNFRSYSTFAQDRLEGVRDQLRDIKDRIYKHIQQKGYDSKTASKERKGLEERELESKLAQLNALVARTGEELVRTSEVSAQTEVAATEAGLAAAQAAEEAKRIQEDYEARQKAQAEARAAEEARREEEERRQTEEEARREEERAAEEARSSRLRKHAEGEKDKAPFWENWPVFTYNVAEGEVDQGVGCLVRADADRFEENSMTCQVLDVKEAEFHLEANEELVGNIVRLTSSGGQDKPQSDIFVAMPHCMSRASAMSREPVLKAKTPEGDWRELRSQEVHFDGYKDLKFVQAEVSEFTSIAVVTRFKRDYLHMQKKGGKISSSVDARVTFTAEKGTFKKTENFVMQLQPVDSVTMSDIKAKTLEGKNLLTSSSIVSMEWTSKSFDNPILMTLPVPPNPVKAKKAAAARAAKEAKMKNQGAPRPLVDDEEERRRAEKRRATKAQQKKAATRGDEEDGEGDGRGGKVTKWYMGQYGNNEEDENDSLFFIRKNAQGRWQCLEAMAVVQIKLDIVQLELHEPFDRFMVLRARTGVEAREAQCLADTIERNLLQRTVNLILKQKTDDLCEVCLTAVAQPRWEKTLKRLEEDGYDEGPGASKEFPIHEGDHLEVTFRGNIRRAEESDSKDEVLTMIFHSQLSNVLRFSIVEVDKFLQKGFSEYRGFVQLLKVTKVVHPAPKKEKEEDEDPEPVVEFKKELLCEHLVKIPKDPEANTQKAVTKVPLHIRNADDCLDEEALRHVSRSLGDEWHRVANQLNVKRVRLQAILRNNKEAQAAEEEVKYDMLLSWVKRVPRSMNKAEILRAALLHSGRPDLAEELRINEKEFQDRRKGVSASE